jgi:sulfite exporter TauE/SafE
MIAAQGRQLPQVGATMLAFALGATLPLIILGQLSRQISTRWRGSLLAVGHHGKSALGVIAGLAGLLILTGLERPLEALLVSASPEWLTRLSTSFLVGRVTDSDVFRPSPAR